MVAAQCRELGARLLGLGRVGVTYQEVLERFPGAGCLGRTPGGLGLQLGDPLAGLAHVSAGRVGEKIIVVSLDGVGGLGVFPVPRVLDDVELRLGLLRPFAFRVFLEECLIGGFRIVRLAFCQSASGLLQAETRANAAAATASRHIFMEIPPGSAHNNGGNYPPTRRL